MPIYRLLQNAAFEPEHVNALSSAFDECCKALGLAERIDPLRDAVARKVIEVAQSGVRDPVRLRQRVLEEFRS